MPDKKPSPVRRFIYRSARTGRWVTAAFARLNPATTVRERRRADRER